MDDVLCSLLCEEDVSCLEEDCGDEIEEQNPFIQSEQNFGDDTEDKYVSVLIEKEISQSVQCFKKDETLVIDDWLKRARVDAIDWILKTKARFGFSFQTVYLSVAYFDRVLSRRRSIEMIQSKYVSDNKYWIIRLLSIACLSLAAKMEECKVPGLSQFHWEDSPETLHSSQGKVIQKMELLVLTTLEWNMGIVTPFAFLSHFITKLCRESPSSPVFSKAMQLILTTMKEINSMDHKPSVIAAAATLVALDQQFTLETVKLKMSLIPQHLEPNDVFGCYILIQRLYEEEKARGFFKDYTPHYSPLGSRPIDMIETSDQVTSAKRRRLTFYDEESHDGKGLH